MIDAAGRVLGRTGGPQTYSWTDRDYMLYAIALGIGADPLREPALPFVYERHLKVVPTFPTVVAWIAEPTFAQLGAHPDHALHSGQSIELHRVLHEPTTVSVTGRVVAVHDKGPRGAVIVSRHEVVRAADAEPLATLTTTCFARDAGGCGSGGEPPVAAPVVPARPPDHIATYAVRADTALLYRLTGDRNPLHADPTAAASAGLARPILHGLCTFGMTCGAVLEYIANWQPERIASHAARFSAVVYPGDTLEVSLWAEGAKVPFEARVPGRGRVVVATGLCGLR